MWDVKACRSCLTVKGKLEKIGDASKRQYSAITGLQISENDGYPNYFCVECRHHIRKSMAFRRKSRRAHFVLKEIMTVRKQISYSDIVTVNRKKTNLESSLNFWEPNNNSCFLIANEEGQEEESLKKYELEEPQTRFHSKHIVEIEPEHDTEIPVEINEQQDEFIDDIPTNDYLEPEPDIDTTNIDMNDVFKDLAEGNQSDDNDVDEFLPLNYTVTNSMKPDKTVQRKTQPYKTDAGLSPHLPPNAVIETYLLFDLTVLNTEQQREKFELRKRIPPFVKALYKCAMCLTIHKHMADLVKHVEFHNDRKYTNECVVCKNKFPTEKDLEGHVAECHLYEYNCRICRARGYALQDAVKHAKNMHSRRDAIVNYKLINRSAERKLSLSNFTITTLSQRMMTDVMMLRSRPENKNKKKKEPDEVKSGEQSSFKCDICGTGFRAHKGLERHMVLRHRYMYTCKLCKEVFTTRAQALQHNDDTHTKHQCEDCGEVFKSSNHLSNHRLKHVKKIPCNLCGHSNKTEMHFYRHQILQHGYVSINDPQLGDPQYKCGTDECGVQFVDKRSLEVHLVQMNHAGVEDVPYACVPCKKIFDNEEGLETHFITCRPSQASKYPRKCCYCTEVLRNAMEYKLHYIHVHPNLQYRYIKGNAICDICGKSVFRPLLEQHLRTHAGAAFECRLCSTVNTTPAAHIAHLLANHARRPYKCALCPRRFKIRGDCKDHILKVHAPITLFKCEFCAAEFSYYRSLKEHAEKLHNLLIPPIKPKIPIRSKVKLHVYAHMKIIINESEREVVNKLDVELVDYLEQKSKSVDANDYFIFSPHAEEVSLTMKKKCVKKKKKKKETEVEAAVARITIDWPEPVVKEEVSELNTGTSVNESTSFKIEASVNESKSFKIETSVNEGKSFKIETSVNEGKSFKIETSVNEGKSYKIEESVNEEEGTVNTEGVAEMEVDKFEIDGKPLEVIENDGHQYVMIDGEMYRIAAEDDDD